MEFFVHIEKKTGIPVKVVIGSLLISIVGLFSAFVYNNYSPPKVEKQINEIQNTQKIQSEQINILSNKVEKIDNKQTTIESVVKSTNDRLDRLIDLMLQNNRVLRNVDNNTK